MPLLSKLFGGDLALEACLIKDSAHVVRGAIGEHVAKIQTALLAAPDGLSISPSELSAKKYGPSTAEAVLKFKKKRSIINRSYQSQADDIVGKMTIAALDKVMLEKESSSSRKTRNCCVDDSMRMKGPDRGHLNFSLASTPVPGIRPKQQAIAMVPAARIWIGRTLVNLNFVIALIKSGGMIGPSQKDLAKLMEFKALKTHFHFDIEGHFDFLFFLNGIKGMYERMLNVLREAQEAFDDNEPSEDDPLAPAQTDRGGFLEPIRGHITFFPNFLAFGPFNQTFVIVHEMAHYVGRDVGHFAREFPAPDGRPQNDFVNFKVIPHFKNYAQLDMVEAMHNCDSYAQFALHMFAGRDLRLTKQGPNAFKQ